jgi:hypothetical protein
MISQPSVSRAWPNLGVSVIFSNEAVNENRAFAPIFWQSTEPLAVVRDRRDH